MSSMVSRSILSADSDPPEFGWSERSFVEIHDGEIAGLGNCPFRSELGQYRTSEPSARGDLALVEGFLTGFGLFIEPVQRHLGAPKQQPGTDHVAERHKQSGGVQAHLVDVAQIAIS